MGKVAVLSVVVLAIAVLIGERMLKLSRVALAFRELEQNYLPNCQHLKGLDFGSEDITILEDGLAFISTGLKYPGLPHYSDDPGKIYVLDLVDPHLNPVEVSVTGEFDHGSFNPHGISVYRDKKENSLYLFVVNHPENKSQVEIFRFVEEDYSMVHQKTIKHELLYSANDVVAVGIESFYATNDRYFSYEIMKAVEVIVPLRWSNVVYYSPEEVKVLPDGFYSANGINISPDHRYLYVSDILNHRVEVMAIEEGNALTRVKGVDVGSLCDNIEVDRETGDLWLGCHPNGAKLHHNDPEDPPGSEVIRIQSIHSEKPVVTQVYADNGSVLIGSSVAARYGGKLLIGTVYHRALCCDLE